jgi:hypothetical protein
MPGIEDDRTITRPAEGGKRLRDRPMRLGWKRDHGDIRPADGGRQAAGDRRRLRQTLAEYASEANPAELLKRNKRFG